MKRSLANHCASINRGHTLDLTMDYTASDSAMTGPFRHSPNEYNETKRTNETNRNAIKQ